MIQTDKLLRDLQEQLRKTDDDQVKKMINLLIGEIVSGKYVPNIW